MPSDNTSALELLLLSPCLMPGNTSFTDSKTTVNINPKNDETILLFSIDDQTNKSCKLRQFLWGKKQGESLCDLIIFYACGEKRILCFAELKDNIGDLGKAKDQVINTHKAVKQKLKLGYTAKAFITAHHGSAPQEHQRYQKELQDAFGKGNHEYNGKGDELDKFLRGEADGNIGKGKRKKNKK
ncbi:MAG: hypothetical protein BWK80_18915 [Desulfobacteraceae bacterium IS3]|nr:MAG: hypothetical protein BWK80_18915 [Desulfobacteraceae bacterium IS3]